MSNKTHIIDILKKHYNIHYLMNSCDTVSINTKNNNIKQACQHIYSNKTIHLNKFFVHYNMHLSINAFKLKAALAL